MSKKIKLITIKDYEFIPEGSVFHGSLKRGKYYGIWASMEGSYTISVPEEFVEIWNEEKHDGQKAMAENYRQFLAQKNLKDKKTMKVKLFDTDYRLNPYDDDRYDALVKGITEWEECTPEEFQLLKEHSQYLVVAQVDHETFERTLAEIIALTEKKQKQRETILKKNKAEEATRKEKSRLRAIEKAQKLLKENGVI